MPSLLQQRGRAAGGDDFDAHRHQFPGKVDQPGFVGNGDERALDLHGDLRRR